MPTRTCARLDGRPRRDALRTRDPVAHRRLRVLQEGGRGRDGRFDAVAPDRSRGQLCRSCWRRSGTVMRPCGGWPSRESAGSRTSPRWLRSWPGRPGSSRRSSSYARAFARARNGDLKQIAKLVEGFKYSLLESEVFAYLVRVGRPGGPRTRDLRQPQGLEGTRGSGRSGSASSGTNRRCPRSARWLATRARSWRPRRRARRRD